MKIIAWVRAIFCKVRAMLGIDGDGHPSIVETVPQIDDSSSEDAAVTTPAASRKKNTREPGYFTLSELLSGLADIHESIGRQIKSYNGLRPNDMNAVRRLGPLVPLGSMYVSDDEVESNRHLLSDESLPGIWSLAWRDTGTDSYCYPVMAYGIKTARVPFYVVPQVGVYYEFSMAYKDSTMPRHHKLYWLHGSFFVRDGRVFAGKNLHRSDTRIGSNSYTRNVWKFPHESGWWPHKTSDAWCRMIESLLIRYVKKDESWLIVSTKDRQRVRFSVPVGRQIAFFKDRDKTAITPTGKRKTLMHLVQTHSRSIGDKTITVKTHIRGARRFTWNGYQCGIFAPKFHSDISDMPVAGLIDFQLSDDEKKNENIPLTQIAESIAQIQEGTLTKEHWKKQHFRPRKTNPRKAKDAA